MEKLSKRAFIKLLEKRIEESEKDTFTAEDIYELFMETLEGELLNGNNVTLTGFGNFELKEHSGHMVRFTDSKKIDSYLTVRFYPSNVFNKRLRNSDDNAKK